MKKPLFILANIKEEEERRKRRKKKKKKKKKKTKQTQSKQSWLLRLDRAVAAVVLAGPRGESKVAEHAVQLREQSLTLAGHRLGECKRKKKKKEKKKKGKEKRKKNE